MKPHLPLVALVAISSLSTGMAAGDDDALDLRVDDASKSVKEPQEKSRELRLAIELARLTARTSTNTTATGDRAAVDLRYESSLAPGWRWGISDRLEHVAPSPEGQRDLRNHLREAYVSWQSDSSARSVELGRINQRHGSAYGYNPSDFFRRGAAQSIVTADPVALRQNRVGTVMASGKWEWAGTGVSLSVAPKLSKDTATQGIFGLGLDGTNASSKSLLTVPWQVSSRLNGEALVYWEDGRPPMLGANFSGLIGDALVPYAEWAYGKMPRLIDASGSAPAPTSRRHQLALGMTYSLAGGLAVTAEAEYNGAGTDRTEWQRFLAGGTQAVASQVGQSQRDQELLSRQAWLLYVTKKSALVKQLDLAGFVRQNAQDHSRLYWAEARYHFPTLDVALQWQQSGGKPNSEYKTLPYARVIQLVAIYYH